MVRGILKKKGATSFLNAQNSFKSHFFCRNKNDSFQVTACKILMIHCYIYRLLQVTANFPFQSCCFLMKQVVTLFQLEMDIVSFVLFMVYK